MPERDTKTRELCADVLIVGGGVAGLCAAMAAAERGADVLIMTPDAAPRARCAPGGFFVESYIQKRAGLKGSKKAAYDGAMYFADYLCDPILMRDAVFGSAETLRWCNSHGAGLRLPDSPRGETPENFLVWDGKAARESFLRELERFGTARLLKGARFSSLTRENGAVTGAVGSGPDGEVISVRARAVLLAAGGYIENGDMLAQAVGDGLARQILVEAQAGGDGAGIKAAWAAGAAKRGFGTLVTCGAATGTGAESADALLRLPLLWVNRDGRRFMNEELVGDTTLFGNALLTQGGCAWVIFDGAALDALKSGRLPLKPAAWDGDGDFPSLSGFDSDFALAEKSGAGFKAETLPELARLIGAEDGVLSKTVLDYNGFVDGKNDRELFKSADSLVFPVKCAPFYALKARLRAVGTSGGVAVDRSFRALDGADAPIPGLYVAGSASGGLCSASYTDIPGFELSRALTGGRLAGTHMAEALGFDSVVKAPVYPNPEEVRQ